ncbi:binding--dependent transport system inner membrane component family protein [Clostridium baratii str. Sullivan]|uniref:Binding--dependent transport system inner membrane component family protein n=1 Tax=Clostridium baratii str. Sullivan TaxID=1415775 RepID=A0A0A7FUL9_9CLOT|nr:sugar ABC transporter permease [Clostridium baratii]AIY82650.1 binding--dependent transport system inner membrane component family protein [Clostridium baratii str. Sullivan]
MNKKKEKIMGMSFFGPALVLLTVFLFIPMILTLVFSFTDFFTLNPSETKFIGLGNYKRLLNDELFIKAFFNTMKFALIVVPLQMGGALLLALGINKVTHCKKYFKIAFFIPVVMSLAVVSTLWMQIYSPEGILNNILNGIGISYQPFIYSKDQALNSISALSIWQGMGYQMIIFLGGLQAISPSLYEAAEIDNASSWNKFWNVTVPELKPISIYILLTITIGAFKLLVQPMIMTGGGPAFSTYSLVYYIYDTGTVNWDMGYSSAMSIIFSLIVIILAGIQYKITNKKEA